MTQTTEKITKILNAEINKAARQDAHIKTIVIIMSNINSNLNQLLTHSNFNKENTESKTLKKDLEKALNLLGTTTLRDIPILKEIQSAIIESKKSLVVFRSSLSKDYNFGKVPETIENLLSTLHSQVNALIQSLD